MMGARAVIDKAVARKTGDHGNLSTGLDELQQANLISQQERSIIEAH